MKRFLITFSIAVCAIFISSMLYSCKGQGDGDRAATPMVALDPGNTVLSPGDIMEIVDWVEIKADSSQYIGNPAKVECFDSEYYILDTRNQKCVMRYSSDGSLVCRIGQLGHGPEEYSSIIDFSIDKEHSLVYILSREATVYSYTIDGAFQRKAKLSEDVITGLACNEKGLMTTTGYSSAMVATNGFLLTEFDSEFKPIGQWFPFTDPKRPAFGHPGAHFLATLGRYTYCFDDVNLKLLVYDSKTNEVSTLMTFELANTMPDEMWADTMRFMAEQLNYNWVKDFAVTGSHVIVGYLFDGKQALTILDLHGNVVASGKYNGPIPQYNPEEEGIILSPVPTDFYLNYWAKLGGIKKPEFQVTEDTNLLLMKWKLKDQPKD